MVYYYNTVIFYNIILSLDNTCILILLGKIVSGPIIVLSVIFIICVCCCYHKIKNRRNGYERIPVNDYEDLQDVADSDEEEEQIEEQENDTNNEGDINQGLPRVNNRSENGNESDIHHDNSYPSMLITAPEQASQYSSQPEEDQPGGEALVTSCLLSVPRYPNSGYDSLSMHSEATPYGSLHNRQFSARQTHSEERSLPHLPSPRRTREDYTLDPAPNTNHLKPPIIIGDDDNEKDGSASQRKLSFPTISKLKIKYVNYLFIFLL